MRQITLRGMDPEVERTIRRMAKASGKSLNRVILDIIRQHTGINKITSAASLRELTGGWSNEVSGVWIQLPRTSVLTPDT